MAEFKKSLCTMYSKVILILVVIKQMKQDAIVMFWPSKTLRMRGRSDLKCFRCNKCSRQNEVLETNANYNSKYFGWEWDALFREETIKIQVWCSAMQATKRKLIIKRISQASSSCLKCILNFKNALEHWYINKD